MQAALRMQGAQNGLAGSSAQRRSARRLRSDHNDGHVHDHDYGNDNDDDGDDDDAHDEKNDVMLFLSGLHQHLTARGVTITMAITMTMAMLMTMMMIMMMI